MQHSLNKEQSFNFVILNFNVFSYAINKIINKNQLSKRKSFTDRFQIIHTRSHTSINNHNSTQPSRTRSNQTTDLTTIPPQPHPPPTQIHTRNIKKS